MSPRTARRIEYTIYSVVIAVGLLYLWWCKFS
jgi:hypothetical protein